MIAARTTLAALALSTLLPAMGTSIATVGLPAMSAAFGASVAQVQWVVVAYLLAVTCLVLPAGSLGDARGRRRVLLGAIGLFTLGSALAGMAPDLVWLVGARAVQGAGAAGMMALTLAFVAASVPRERVGSAMGLLGAMSAAGTALGPTLGGLLVALAGWRGIFLVNVPLGVLAFWLAWRSLPVADARSPGPGIDWREFAPALPRLMMAALVATVLMATLVAGPFYLARALLLAPAAIGIVMSAGPLVAALCGVPAGRAVDRYGATRMTTSGLALLAVGSVAMAMLPVRAGVPGYLAALVTITAGYALFQAANNSAAMAGAERSGAISGMLNLARNLGLLAGASVMGVLFAVPADAVSGLHLTFAVAATLVVAALVCADNVKVLAGR